MLRGIGATLLMAVYEMYYDYFFGIRTRGMENSGKDPDYHYQGAGYYILLKVFNEIKSYSNSHVFFDIGFGKGRALVVAEYFGFQKIQGVELDKNLFQLANKNLTNRKRGKPETKFSIQQGSAQIIEYTSESTLYFLFNPFNDEVLRAVLKSIKQHNQQKKIFVYLNPIHRNVFEEMGFKSIKEIKTNKYIEAVIFISE